MLQREFFLEKLIVQDNDLQIFGVAKVVEVCTKQAVFKLSKTTLSVKGDGLSITSLDKDKGIVALEFTTLSSVSYKNGIVGGLFK